MREMAVSELLDCMNDAIFIHDAEGRIHEVNRAAREMLGYSREELLALRTSDLEPSEYVALYPDRVRQIEERGECFVETFVKARSNDIIAMEFRTRFVEFDDRKMLLSVGRDVTGRKRAREHATWLAAAFEQSAEAMAITDAQGDIFYVNPAFESMTGCSNDELAGRKPPLFQEGVLDEKTQGIMWRRLRFGRPWRGEFSATRADGSRYDAEALASPVRDETGTIAWFVVGLTDVTQERQLRNQLRQSQRMEAIGQLAGGVAHDFNNILQVLQGYTYVLMRRIGPGDPLYEDLKEIIEASNRAGALTRQLLTFSRKQILQPQPVDLNQLVGNLLKMLRRVIGEDIELDLSMDESLESFRADPGQMEQILMNLCVNARDAMTDGGKIHIKTERFVVDEEFRRDNPWAEAERYARLSVSDNGCGIPDDVIGQIFEPFFTTKERGSGTGLGLSTVYGIVKQHNGHISACGEVGRGTTFDIFLPLNTDWVEQVEETRQSAVEGGDETILVAEDETSVRRLYEKVLTDYGYKVLLSNDGDEAVRLFREKKDEIALAILDVVMPNRSGQSACDEIRSIAPDVPVLFSSGYSAKMLDSSLLKAERLALIQKPFAPEDLLRQVRGLIDRARSNQGEAPRT